MQFFTTYFTKHHFTHTPHKWFLAFLLSPIHFAELHYKNRYHLKYENARKLFIFDITLLLSAVFLFGTTIFLFNYNPEVTNLVYLSIHPTANKVKSGEYVEYQISYKNQSDQKLVSPTLSLKLPTGFILISANPENLFDKTKQSFKLNDLGTGETGVLSVAGWIYGTPDKDENITATLSYRQNSRQVFEEKNTLLIKTLRGSVLVGKIIVPTHILYNGNTPINLEFQNTGSQNLTNLQVPLNQNPGLSLEQIIVNKGIIENDLWYLDKLEPNESVFLTAELKNTNPATGDKISLNFTPVIKINNTSVPQSPLIQEVAIAYPKAQITSNWQNDLAKIQPGETATLQIQIKNNGNINLVNGQLSLPLSSAIIDVPATQKLNLGQIKNNNLIISVEQISALKELKINDTANINIQLLIKNIPQGGTDLSFAQGINWQSNVAEIKNSLFQTDGLSPNIKIGTSVAGTPELRYYTFEGDQLGRGPLPPQVGQETKYWVFIPISNGTSKISNLKLSAELPSFVNWTGKSSVTFGNNPVYDANKRNISWTLNSLNAHTTAGVYFELGFTPTTDQVGTSPILIKNINFSAVDTYLETTINKNFGDLDISLKTDALGQSKGVKITN
ncbi:MAG: hypothetical protein US42_C0004G0018 [Candidatus Magasanikbacteria bacterium GW2011_GWC2_37_14]|uniref:DUF11 domain-containing protein n=1 Tax=Candidatus Magasanikbacteria bacterium GW2011_GWC2_37_14 TaxID=1619046 RepID=A0A0G0IUN9_9BACT|nr:MAG: hypothetical protein US42_C0004G0018 [Candidatus Magasanikbacteria bacterium GW2011_GWC2_37_14]